MKRKLLAILFFAFSTILSVSAQNKTITGRVLGADDGLPLPGVSVRVKGGTQGTTTSGDGTFSLSAPSDSKTLVITYIGYVTQEIAVPASGSVSLRLVTDAQQIAEV
ncbi:MAG: SusC/RagA family TonB-linked outer membrane protein, partial [Bacteroidetes bacterium]|nr:SusC/RagA family TonB-linked outer membrane protein [Bacteroidota bacterium]